MLDVFLYGTHIGTLSQDSRSLTFKYNDTALDSPERYALSVRLPVRPEPFSDIHAASFFDNLLPEGDSRTLIAQANQYDGSDVQALLGAIGGECAGAVSLWPAGQRPIEPPKYRTASLGELEGIFGSGGASEFARAHVEGRQSMSGAQNKLALLRDGTAYRLPIGGAPTNVIMKQERRRYPGLVQNEIASLALMREAGVTIATGTAVVGTPRLFESARYDRSGPPSDLARIHQEDFCQATGRLPRQKYQSGGGPTYAEIASVLVQTSANPIDDLDSLARWAIANACIGNNDAHAKNLSMLYGADGPGLSPFYDVVSTTAYPSIADTFAIGFGGARSFADLRPDSIRKFARSVNLTERVLSRIADEVTANLTARAVPVCHDVAERYGDVPALESITRTVAERVPKFRELFSLAGKGA